MNRLEIDYIETGNQVHETTKELIISVDIKNNFRFEPWDKNPIYFDENEMFETIEDFVLVPKKIERDYYFTDLITAIEHRIIVFEDKCILYTRYNDIYNIDLIDFYNFLKKHIKD